MKKNLAITASLILLTLSVVSPTFVQSVGASPPGGGGTAPQTASSNCPGSGNFFGLIPWYDNLVAPDPNNPNICSVKLDLTKSSNWNAIWVIVLNIVEDLLRITGLIAVIMIIVGGIRFVVSQGEPENVKSAQGTIQNGLIGLVIASFAGWVVGYISGQLGGQVVSAQTGNYHLPNVVANSSLLSIILNLVMSIAGAIAVIIIILAGFKYVTSQGESSKINQAKNSILYAAIGLTVDALAFVIVNFVLSHI